MAQSQVSFAPGQIVKGTVIEIRQKEVMIDIGYCETTRVWRCRPCAALDCGRCCTKPSKSCGRATPNDGKWWVASPV